MSLAGSLVFLVYLVFRPVTVRCFSSAWRYGLLKLVLLFYLFPYEYFKYSYYDIFHDIFFHRPYQSPESLAGFSSYDFNRLVLVDSEGNRSLRNGEIIFAVLAVWGIAVISFAAYQIVKYISCKRDLRRISTAPDPRFYAILDQCRKQAHMKKKVDLVCCPYINACFTMGVFSPRIILPDIPKDEKAFQMIFSHELTHVKNHDILIKFLALLVMALQWYNPLTYLLYWEICKVHECVCDETVIRGMTREEKEYYKSLIIEMAQKPPQADTFFANALGSSFKIMRERITLMDRPVVSPKLMRMASFASAVLLLVMSPLPVLAYSPIVTGRSVNPDNDMDFDDEYVYLGPDQDAFHVFGVYDPFLELGTDHDIFVDDNGIPNVIIKTASQTERSSCDHIWNNGQIHRHSKNNDGSCTVNIYEAKMCSGCNEYTVGSLINSVNYAVCPH